MAENDPLTVQDSPSLGMGAAHLADDASMQQLQDTENAANSAAIQQQRDKDRDLAKQSFEQQKIYNLYPDLAAADQKAKGTSDTASVMLNLAYRVNKPLEEVRQNYQMIRSGYAQAQGWDVSANDTILKTKFQEQFQQEDAREQAVTSLQNKAVQDAVTYAGKGMSRNPLMAFSEWDKEAGEVFNDATEAQKLQIFNSVYYPVQKQMNTPEGALAKQIVDAYGNKPMAEEVSGNITDVATATAKRDPILNALGVTSRDGMAPDDQKEKSKAAPILDQLAQMTFEQRQKVYQLAGTLEKSKNPEQTGFLASLYSIGQSINRAADNNILFNESDPLAAQKQRVALELKEAAKNTVNPLLYSDKHGYESLPIMLTSLGQGLGGAAPFIAANALAPGLGIAYLHANMTADEQARQLVKNPNMTPAEALAVSQIAAIPSTILMGVNIMGLRSVAPALDNALSKLPSIAQNAAAIGIGGAAFTAAGASQNFADSIINAINPEWNKDADLKQGLTQTLLHAPQDFLLAAVFHIAQRGGQVDPKKVAELAADPANLVKQGIPTPEAKRIAATPEEERPAAVMEALDKVTPEQRQDGIDLSIKEAEEVKKVAEDPNAPKLVHSEDGTPIVITHDAEGGVEHTQPFGSDEAAQQGLQMAFADHAERKAATAEEGNDWTTATEGDDMPTSLFYLPKDERTAFLNETAAKVREASFESENGLGVGGAVEDSIPMREAEPSTEETLPESQAANPKKTISRQFGNYPKGTEVEIIGERSKDPLDTNLRVRFPDGTEEKFPIAWLKTPKGQMTTPKESLPQLVKRLGREGVNELLAEWQDAELSPDGNFILGVIDPRSSMKQERIPVREFLDWVRERQESESKDQASSFPTTKEEVQAQLDDLVKKREEEQANPPAPEPEAEFGPEAPQPEPEPPAEPNPLEEAPAPAIEDKPAKKAAKGKAKSKDTDGITDFGEKIEGAKKDLWQRYEAAIQTDLPSDVKEITLSKHFPEPDYGKLIEGGASLERVAAMKAIRDLIPRKPQNRYKLARWGELVKSLHDVLKVTVSPESQISNERLNEILAQSPAIAGKVDLYRELGYPAYLGAKDWDIKQSRGFSWFGGEKIPTSEYVTYAELDGRMVAVNSRSQDLPAARREVAQKVASMIESKQDRSGGAKKKGRTTTFNIYRDSENAGKFYIGKKGLTSVIRVKAGFEKVQDAFNYVKDNHADLSKLWEQLKTQTTGRRDTNQERTGKPQRTGNITPETFSESFGFRGVQFGNYVEGSRRQADLNHSFDALMDLSEAIGVSPKALSLDGQLGMAFGARGKGGKNIVLAHYEPDNVVINLTKAGGPGTLAHEWFHAVDNYFNRLDKTGNSDWKSREFNYASDNGKPPVNMRPEVWEAFKTLRDALENKEFSKRAKDLDETRSKPYWNTTIEKAARAFESYINERLAEKGISNDYLANIDESTGAYPTKAELEGGIRQAFDGLFNAIDDTELPKLAASIKTRLNLSRVTGESGGIDPTIFEDVADYGTRIFEKGMEFKDWAGKMLNDLGDSVKGVLARIWQAYKSLGNEGSIGGKADDFASRVKGQQPRGAKAKAFFTPDAENGNKVAPALSFKEQAKITAGKVMDAVRDLPKDSDFKREVLKWSARSQGSTNEIERVQRSIEQSIPDKAKREGITNWIEADGDKSLLRERAAATTDAKLKAGYEAALNFTQEEIAIAKKVQQTFNVLETRAKKYGIDMGHRENYVPHVFEQEPQPPSGTTPKRLSEFFKFSQTRVFDSYFEGEQVTDKDGNPAPYKAQTKDIAKLLGLYMNDMNNAINSRRFVAELSKGKASDGRPLVSPRGGGKAVQGENGEDTMHLVYPDSAKEGHEDYKIVDQPALHDWSFAGKDDLGVNIMVKGDLAVHPEVAKHFENALGSSAISKWMQAKTENPFLNGGKWVADKFIKSQSLAKGTMLSFSPFHQVQEAIHAMGHRVNPFADIPKIDLRDEKQADAAAHGLMIAHDRLSQSLFMEGVGDNNSNLVTMGLRKIGWGLTTEAADKVDAYQHWLFSEYIPGLKLKTYEHILERNMERYKGDIESGVATEWQVKVLSAKQSNAAYGHLNYTEMGHNPTIRHAMQLVLLAPDFLEARSRFVGQAFKGFAGGKVGYEQLQALAFLAATQFVAATIQKVLTNGDPEFDHPFEMRVGNKYYGVRSVPEDIYKLIGNPTGFIGGRISPIFGRFVQEGIFGVNYRGEHTTVGDAITDIMAGTIPMPMQAMTRQWTASNQANPISWWEQIMASAGLQVHRYSPITKIYPLAKEWLKENHPEDQTARGAYPVSKFQQLRYACEDGDQEKINHEIERLKTEQGLTRAKINSGFKTSVMHPFTGSKSHDADMVASFTEDQKEMYHAAVERRKLILQRFMSLAH